jgi:hypothetical protein
VTCILPFSSSSSSPPPPPPEVNTPDEESGSCRNVVNVYSAVCIVLRQYKKSSY